MPTFLHSSTLLDQYLHSVSSHAQTEASRSHREMLHQIHGGDAVKISLLFVKRLWEDELAQGIEVCTDPRCPHLSLLLHSLTCSQARSPSLLLLVVLTKRETELNKKEQELLDFQVKLAGRESKVTAGQEAAFRARKSDFEAEHKFSINIKEHSIPSFGLHGVKSDIV